MFTRATACRACQGTELIPVFSLGLMPLSNDFCLPDEPRQGFAPLEICFCPKCTLSQLSVVINPHILYDKYLYVTSSSLTMQRHFERLLQDLVSEGVESSIFEIGSNIGSFLKFAKTKGFTVLGMDPARNLAEIAEQDGIPTYPSFFGEYAANCASQTLPNPSVILARHCFAHINDWREFVRSLEILAKPKTLIAIEVPYVHNMLSHTEFDTAYFEHLSYVSLTAVAHLLKGTPFHIHRVQHYMVHGGAVLIMLRHKDSGIQPHLSADEYLSEDAVTVPHWERFSINARQKINRMREAVLDANEKGKIVCGFGASAKASVWISAMGFNSKQIRFVSDNSPLKPGRLMPGTDIPIILQDELLSNHPDLAICFAWNYKSEILESQKKWRERGGKFLFPTPDGVEIV